MMPLVDTNIDVKYKDGGFIMDKDSKGSIYRRIQGRGSENGNRRWIIHCRGRQKVIHTQINLSLLKLK